VGLHTAIGGAVPELLQLCAYSVPEMSERMGAKSSEKISSEAAALICTLTKHCESLGILIYELLTPIPSIFSTLPSRTLEGYNPTVEG
jgi:hypothetical protein